MTVPCLGIRASCSGAINPLAMLVDGVSGLTTTRLSSGWIVEGVVEAVLDILPTIWLCR